METLNIFYKKLINLNCFRREAEERRKAEAAAAAAAKVSCPSVVLLETFKTKIYDFILSQAISDEEEAELANAPPPVLPYSSMFIFSSTNGFRVAIHRIGIVF